jgi:hypothetical protein
MTRGPVLECGCPLPLSTPRSIAPGYLCVSLKTLTHRRGEARKNQEVRRKEFVKEASLLFRIRKVEQSVQ